MAPRRSLLDALPGRDDSGRAARQALPATRSLLLLALVGVAACGPDAPTNLEFAAQQLDAGAGDGSGGGDGGGGGTAHVVPTIDGTWLQFSQISTCINFIRIQEGISRTLFIIHSTQDENGFVDESWRACALELPPVLNIENFATPALINSVYPVESHDGFVTGTSVGAGYASGLLSEPWGLDLDDPLHDPFPTDTSDPRIIDADHDGHPGVTVLVSDQCETYIAQRAITAFNGTFTAPDRIEGTMVSFTSQLTVGASTPFCASSYETRPNDPRNIFVRIRVDGQGGAINLDENHDGDITCNEVSDFADETFVRREPDDSTCLR